MTKIVSLAFFFFLSYSLAQTNYVDYLIQGSQLGSEKKYDQAISVYQQILQSNPPAWAQVGAYYGLFFAYTMKNQTDLALNALEKGIQAGMNDFVAIHDEPAYRVFFQNPRFIQLYNQMRISQADTMELYWIYSEFQAINHETIMLITANMNRKDSDYTEVFQVDIPTRTPQCSTLLLGREYVRYLQNVQKNQVLQSDISRLNHLMQMNIINNMPSGGTDDPNMAYRKEQQRLQDIEDARRQARSSA
ncbi:MAG: tetratricopeptide repeat protein [Planctomycetota bacterium]